jgi:phosphoribosylformylglycinamidine (FGAM) synthase-like enzyme
MHRKDTTRVRPLAPLAIGGLTLAEAVRRVLVHPTVADKTFLISIGDRSVTGLVARDQMVGAVAGARRRLRGHRGVLRRVHGRGHGHG